MDSFKIKWADNALESLEYYTKLYHDIGGIRLSDSFLKNIDNSLEALIANPYIARPSMEVPELREYVVQKYPFLIAYYINDSYLYIASFLHQRQNSKAMVYKNKDK